VAIVHGDVPPINPVDPKRSHVHIFNNIFLSFAVDGRYGEEYSGDLVSRQTMNLDIHGLRAVGALPYKGLHTLATCVVDYRGVRLLAQSIIPGIFKSDREERHLYGSMNQGTLHVRTHTLNTLSHMHPLSHTRKQV
jgi:protein TIF31